MDQHLSSSPSQTRSPSVLTPLFSSSQAAYCSSPVDLAYSSILNPYTTPLARVHAPQSSLSISNTQTQASPAALRPPFAHRTSLPASYNMSSNGIFPSPIGAASLNSTQAYYPAYSSYNGYPLAIPIAAPLATMPQTSFQENSPNDDPSSTTVFVAGLPACITEDTLKTFFQNFGEIAYVKIPPHKGYGFVKYVRREDAKQAIIKMNDFPIHEKSRIRLSWGRSLGDKKVEYVKKLSSTLGISFESVWKIVQGQDPAAIKQIVSTVCGHSIGQAYEQSNPPTTSPLDQLHQVDYFPEFTPATQSNAASMNVFPSVISTHIPASSIDLAHKNVSPDVPGLSIRTEAHRFPSVHAATSEPTKEFQPRQTPSRTLESALPFNSRPKALSQGSGSASLPPPSWAMRHSWQELAPSGKSSQPVESPTNSVDGIRFPDAGTSRRATIPSVTPSTFHYDHLPPSQRYQAASPASAFLSSSQASSMDSLEASTFGFKNVAKDHNSVVKGRDEYHLGCDGFLHELLEEGREGAGSEHEPYGLYKTHASHLPGDGLRSDSSVWSTPSVAKSSPLSERDGSDWPRSFLGSKSTTETASVKNIFDSAFKFSSQSHQTRETDDCIKDTPSGGLDSWSFPSSVGNPNRIVNPNLSDPSPSHLPSALNSAFNSLDSFYSLSL
ncbi:hypothetical protein PGT21_028876 [Puccinia graminis f. sp. tritici]|uniref:RRM domain-containing protein n=2 Tax=Puccinia graminis f. sp. tritici TaxID=56615 RepID=E3K208_PUCGT|nr:uncharacterized protein PGTG_04333 [Puccinia graminis f. sp. tritici CRL 75-36-700-3]EFP78377.1 hypothetical protein PGTG_04333 [Puccinia graminis f. sp. tritici CRL 75-36-700-3]KAA1119552.1 hypothetical protein PGT21_028876 [Puccinia graminis f. sp. tritici]